MRFKSSINGLKTIKKLWLNIEKLPKRWLSSGTAITNTTLNFSRLQTSTNKQSCRNMQQLLISFMVTPVIRLALNMNFKLQRCLIIILTGCSMTWSKIKKEMAELSFKFWMRLIIMEIRPKKFRIKLIAMSKESVMPAQVRLI